MQERTEKPKARRKRRACRQRPKELLVLQPLEREMVYRGLCGNPGGCKETSVSACRGCGFYLPVYRQRVAALRRRNLQAGRS